MVREECWSYWEDPW